MIMSFLKHILKIKYIAFILITVVLFGFAGIMYDVLIISKQKSMVIEFNYPGAEKGLNPDGSIFEISELKSPDVIEKAKENLKDKDIDTEFLRSRVFITTRLTGQPLDDIVAAVQNEENIVYMPTTLYAYYTQKSKFSKNEAALFMESLEKAYAEYFGEKYSEKNDVLIYKADDYDFEHMDYMEIHQVFKDKIDVMLSYLKTHQNENNTFYSEDGVNLGMAAKKLESFRNINLEKFYSYIVQNGISKSNSEYVKELDYQISENETTYEKMHNASDISKAALGEYAPGIAAIAFIPSINTKQKYYMSRTTTGIDELTKRSYDDGIEAARTLDALEDYRSLRDKFSNFEATGDDKRQITEEMIKTLSHDLETLSEEVLKTDNEYLEHKTSNYFKVYLRDRSGGNVIIKFIILGFLFAFAIMIFIEFFEKLVLKKLQVFEEAFSSIELVKKKRGE